MRSLCFKETSINVDQSTLVGDVLDFMHILLIFLLVVKAVAGEDFGANGTSFSTPLRSLSCLCTYFGTLLSDGRTSKVAVFRVDPFSTA